MTSHGEYITAFNCDAANFHMSMPGYMAEDYNVSAVYIGAHFTNEQYIVFQKAKVEYSYLPEWFGVSGFEHRRDVTDNGVLTQHNVKYTFPNTYAATGLNYNIETDFSLNVNPEVHNVNLHQLVSFKFTLRERISPDRWLNEYFSSIQNFLTLATDRPNHIDSITFYLPNEEEGRDTAIKFYVHLIYRDEKEIRHLHPQDMLFGFNDISEKFGETINRWIILNKELRTTANLFFGSRYRPGSYADSRFLTLAQAAEIYHRSRKSNLVLPRSKHKRKIASITARVPKIYRAWLKDNLAYSNEPRLRHRITELLDMTDDIITPIVRDKAIFAKRITDTRNYFTHFSSGRERAASGVELYWLTESLSFVLQRCLLEELGFSSEQCVELFRRNKRYTGALMHAEFSW
jgi:hypothetical protein